MWKYFSMLLGGLCSLFLVLNSKQPQYRYPSVINCGRGLKRGYTEESLRDYCPLKIRYWFGISGYDTGFLAGGL